MKQRDIMCYATGEIGYYLLGCFSSAKSIYKRTFISNMMRCRFGRNTNSVVGLVCFAASPGPLAFI